MNKKGISLVSLSITIVIMLILLSTISISITYSVSNAKKLAFAKEIYNVQSLVTEYIQKEQELPVTTSTIQIATSDMEQFNNENVLDGKLTLDILDLVKVDIKNTNYGNGSLGNTETEKEKDVYAVSKETGKVYYIAGFKAGNKIYYTLTDELLNMVEKKQDLQIGEKTISFVPSKLGWTNEAISVKVNVPSDYVVTNIGVDNVNITYTSETSNGIITFNINDAKIKENYVVTVAYVKNGTAGSISYTTKIDTEVPIISKDNGVANTNLSIKGINATDSKSGIRTFKYAEGAIENNSNIKEYMNSYGKSITKGTIKVRDKSVYTLYAEDKAGNYSVMYLDSSGTPFEPSVLSLSGTDKIILANSRSINLNNYTIYGNSIQNETPSESSPVKIQSVGDYNKNFFNINDIRSKNGNVTVEENKLILEGTTTTKAYAVYRIPGADYAGQTVTLSFESSTTNMTSTPYYNIKFYDANNTSISQINGKRQTEASYDVPDNTGYIVLEFYSSNSNIDTIATFSNIQLELGAKKTDYIPYGKYDIQIDIMGKNLLDIDDMTITLTNQRSKNTYTDIVLKAGEIYTISFNYDIENISDYGSYYFLGIGYGNKGSYSKDILNKIYNVELMQGKMAYAFTVPQDADGMFLSFRFLRMINAGNAQFTISNIQLERGDTSQTTTYEPYGAKKSYSICLDEPLRKVGNFVDYIDLINGQVVRNVGVIDDTGALPLEQSYKGLETPSIKRISLPVISLDEGTNVINVNTKVPPSQTVVSYFSK